MYSDRSLRANLVCAIIAVLVSCSDALAGGTLFVDDDATKEGEGTSWDTAYRFLQDALETAAGGAISEIHVAQGIYKPFYYKANAKGIEEREVTFQLINGVALMGGYAGIGADDPDARDVVLYETMLSGDLLGNDGPNFENNQENSYHVLVGSFTSSSSILDGFTITGGNANGLCCTGSLFRGGGIFMDQGSPTIIDCTFRENFGRRAGAVYLINDCQSLFMNCSFFGNAAESGGAIAMVECDPTFIGCIFDSNNAFGDGQTPENAGAIHISSGSPTFTDCVFSNNVATRSGGAIEAASNSQALFRGCLFQSNECGLDGGAFSSNNASPVLVNCLFLGNFTTGEAGVGSDGGGFHHDGTADPPPVLRNCVFSGNEAFRAGGWIG